MAGTKAVTEETRAQIVSLVRDFVRREVAPVAARYDHDDIYPVELVDTMRKMGLFGITIPEEYGGLGLDCQGRREIRPCGGAKVYHLSGDVQRKCPPTTGVVGSP